MSFQIQGNGGVIAEVDGTTFRALRVTARPVNYGSLGFYRIGAVTGTIAVSLGATSELFQFRWPEATNLALIYYVDVAAGGNVAATAAALTSFQLFVARAWTAAGSGGTRLTMSTNNAKLRASMGTSLVNDIGIATTAALTIGTKTLDATAIGAVAYSVTTGALTTAMNGIICPQTRLFEAASEGQHPLVLAQEEGFVIRNGNAHPAGMTWHLSVQCAWAEVASF
jgi:hypothetical protein